MGFVKEQDPMTESYKKNQLDIQFDYGYNFFTWNTTYCLRFPNNLHPKFMGHNIVHTDCSGESRN